MSSDICKHPWYHHHNQDNRHPTPPTASLCLWDWGTEGKLDSTQRGFYLRKQQQLVFAQLLPGNQHLLSNYYMPIIMLHTARGLALALKLGRQIHTQQCIGTQGIKKTGATTKDQWNVKGKLKKEKVESPGGGSAHPTCPLSAWDSSVLTLRRYKVRRDGEKRLPFSQELMTEHINVEWRREL